jgi:hypothetical protein
MVGFGGHSEWKHGVFRESGRLIDCLFCHLEYSAGVICWLGLWSAYI